MEKKIYFLGESEDFVLAQKLFGLVKNDLKPELKVAVAEKEPDSREAFDVVVYPYGTTMDKSITAKTLTYSLGQSNADICGFNFQKREKSRSLDIFSQSFMGRVNIPLSSEFTEASVLYCVAGLVGAGAPLLQILKTINESIS